MSAICEQVRGWLPEYGRDALSPSERRVAREHLARCAACRAAAAGDDPVLLFSSLPAPVVSTEEVAAVVASVRTGIALKQAERRIGGGSGWRRGGAAHRRAVRAAAAAAVLLITLAVPSGLRSPEGERGVAVPVARVPEAGGLAAAAAPATGVKATGGATVYDFNPGAGEPRVVWIVDGSLDI